ncbi:unnamed protein product [Soboliphyme baturini]|uniref:Uncharacterized protein n=1 Tax=Soboliphyme baturini TaxID=241478 RepID=A0A183IJT1_9BILA|nr:unnamed protein product [Soboliphyme baturini]
MVVGLKCLDETAAGLCHHSRFGSIEEKVVRAKFVKQTPPPPLSNRLFAIPAAPPPNTMFNRPTDRPTGHSCRHHHRRHVTQLGSARTGGRTNSSDDDGRQTNEQARDDP